jgi:hypothetical protein
MVYWADATILPPGDPEARRAVVVLAAPARPNGTVTVAARSTVDGFGVEHPAGDGLGFSVPGRFSRRFPVQRDLWTDPYVTPIGMLEEAVFAAVLARFTL